MDFDMEKCKDSTYCSLPYSKLYDYSLILSNFIRPFQASLFLIIQFYY